MYFNFLSHCQAIQARSVIEHAFTNNRINKLYDDQKTKDIWVKRDSKRNRRTASMKQPNWRNSYYAECSAKNVSEYDKPREHPTNANEPIPTSDKSASAVRSRLFESKMLRILRIFLLVFSLQELKVTAQKLMAWEQAYRAMFSNREAGILSVMPLCFSGNGSAASTPSKKGPSNESDQDTDSRSLLRVAVFLQLLQVTTHLN